MANIWAANEHTEYLIEVWTDERLQWMLQTSLHNKDIFEEIARRLNARFKERPPGAWTFEQCRNKIKTMKKEYRRAKQEQDRSGHGRTKFRYFDQLDGILGCRHVVEPLTPQGALLLGTDTRTYYHGGSNTRDSDDDDLPSSGKRRRYDGHRDGSTPGHSSITDELNIKKEMATRESDGITSTGFTTAVVSSSKEHAFLEPHVSLGKRQNQSNSNHTVDNFVAIDRSRYQSHMSDYHSVSRDGSREDRQKFEEKLLRMVLAHEERMRQHDREFQTQFISLQQQILQCMMGMQKYIACNGTQGKGSTEGDGDGRPLHGDGCIEEQKHSPRGCENVLPVASDSVCSPKLDGNEHSTWECCSNGKGD